MAETEMGHRHYCASDSEESARELLRQRPQDWKRPAVLTAGWLASLGAMFSAGRFSATAGVGTNIHSNVGKTAPDTILKDEAASVTGYHGIFADHLRDAKHIDLTHAFSPHSPVWPGFGPSGFSAGVGGQDMKGFVHKGDEFKWGVHGFQTSSYTLTTDQLGTQLDPPAHWNELGATISDLPATFALRPLVVIYIHEEVAKNASYHANVSDVLAWETKYGTIPRGSAVMFRSDWSKGWDRYKEDGLPAEYPGVNLDVLRLLHTERDILFHGHEPLDTDMTPSLEGEAWLMHNNFAQAEGVTNLDQVPETGCLISIGFAKPLGGTGGYARYVAICPADAPHGDTIEDIPGAPLRTQPHPLRRDDFGVLRPRRGATPTVYCAKGFPALGCNADGQPVW